MAFLEFQSPHYIKRTRVFVNSAEAVEDESIDNYRFSFPLDEELTDVIGIELVGYQFFRVITPTFLNDLDLFKYLKFGTVQRTSELSNTLYDIELTTPDGLNQLVFTGDMSQAVVFFITFPLSGRYVGNGFSQQTELLTFFNVFDVYARYALANDPVLNDTDFPLAPIRNAHRQVEWILTDAGTSEMGTVRFLFGTGPNKLSQASIPLGYLSDLDTIPEADTKGALAPFRPNPSPWRHLNLFLKEAEDLQPVARIYPGDDKFPGNSRPYKFPSQTRILKKPVRSMRRMRMELKLDNGRTPAFLGDKGIDFTFDVLSLSQTQKVPEWMRQKFTL